MRKVKKILVLVVLPAVITLSLLVGSLFAAEFIMRKRDPHYLQELSSDYINHGHHFSPIYGWEMNKVDLGDFLRVNKKGYRGKEYPYERTNDKTRIVILGDSIGFGFKIDEDDVYSYLLDSKDENLEVINLAVVGYGTDQELIKLKREGLQFNPDIVLLNLSLDNDTEDNASSKFIFDYEHPKPYYTYEDGELILHDEHVHLPLMKRWAFILSQKSIVYNELLDLIGVDRKEHKESLIEPAIQREPDYDLTFRLVRRMHDICTERGIKFMCLVYPNRATFDNDGSESYDKCFSSPILEDVALVNMYEEYKKRGYSGSSKKYNELAYDNCFHLSPPGHRETVKIVREVLDRFDFYSPDKG